MSKDLKGLRCYRNACSATSSELHLLVGLAAFHSSFQFLTTVVASSRTISQP